MKKNEKSTPCVSIGLPVYNGENYLKEALDSLLNQTFTDFELIISDNASTDKTPDICKTYAQKDKRIRYYKNHENIGAAKNFNRVFELSNGEYFNWASHDDVWAPNFLSRCVEILNTNKSVVLVHSKSKPINELGEPLDFNYVQLMVNSPKPQDRFKEVFTTFHNGNPIFGLIRSSTLKSSPLLGGYAVSDNILLLNLALSGPFIKIPEYLFFYRRHKGQSLNILPDEHKYTEWFDPSTKGKMIFPNWKRILEGYKAIKNSQLSFYERAMSYSYLFRYLLKKRVMKKMFKDLFFWNKRVRNLHYRYTQRSEVR